MPQPLPVCAISSTGVGVAVGSSKADGVPGPGVGLGVKVEVGVRVTVAVPGRLVGAGVLVAARVGCLVGGIGVIDTIGVIGCSVGEGVGVRLAVGVLLGGGAVSVKGASARFPSVAIAIIVWTPTVARVPVGVFHSTLIVASPKAVVASNSRSVSSQYSVTTVPGVHHCPVARTLVAWVATPCVGAKTRVAAGSGVLVGVAVAVGVGVAVHVGPGVGVSRGGGSPVA